MVDTVTRSRMMSGIKSKNTKPEVSIRKALHARGFRYRMHVNNLPGKPDLVFPKYKAVVFVHGCFWHGHSCRYFKVPKTRSAFWIDKIQKNRDRDGLQVNALLVSGWRVLLIWECAVKSAVKGQLPALMDQIVGWLESGEKYMQIQENLTE
ncbi:very short patch repair endonuclease [Pseudomonas moraviensis]